MGIIHTAKKDVPALLYKRYASEKPETAFNENKVINNVWLTVFYLYLT